MSPTAPPPIAASCEVMIDLHYWPTPNGWKISILLEELELPYAVHLVNIGRGEQFRPEFLAIAPNNRMPAIVDHAPTDGGAPLSIFESGAIMEYLATKTGKLMPQELRGRTEVMQWLFWQMGGLGPMMGQANHFAHYAPERIEYATRRYIDETKRLFSVLDRRLEGRDYLAAEQYSIADIASYAWVIGYRRFPGDVELEDYPNVGRWVASIGARPAVQRGMSVGKEERSSSPTLDDEAKKHLFGQTHAGPRDT